MNFSFLDLVSIDECLADALRIVGDEDMRQFPKGFYQRQARRGIEQLSFHTYFLKLYTVFDVPETLVIDMPSGSFNMRDIYVYSPTSDMQENTDPQIFRNDCIVSGSMRCFYKSGFIRGVNGAIARNMPFRKDPFIITHHDNEELYFGMANGQVFLSEACKNYKKVMLVYNGVPRDIYTRKIIPPFAAEAIIGFVVERTLFAMLFRDKSLMSLWQMSRDDLYNPRSRTEPGKWDNAKYLLRKMDKKSRDDFYEYMSKLNY